MLRLAVNAVPLRYPATGIGQYIRHLTAAIAARTDIDIRYFYGTHWQRRAHVAALPLENTAKRVIKKTIPLSYVIMRLAQRPVFAAGVRAFHPHVYHEPNYVAFPFRGPTVVTVHDLSFVHYLGNSVGANVESVNMTVTAAAGAGRVDMSQMIMKIGNNINQTTLNYTDTGVATVTAFSLTMIRDPTGLFGLTTPVIDGSSLVSINVLLTGTDVNLPPRAQFHIELIPEFGSPTIIDGVTPASYSTSIQALYP